MFLQSLSCISTMLNPTFMFASPGVHDDNKREPMASSGFCVVQFAIIVNVTSALDLNMLVLLPA